MHWDSQLLLFESKHISEYHMPLRQNEGTGQINPKTLDWYKHFWVRAKNVDICLLKCVIHQQSKMGCQALVFQWRFGVATRRLCSYLLQVKGSESLGQNNRLTRSQMIRFEQHLDIELHRKKMGSQARKVCNSIFSTPSSLIHKGIFLTSSQRYWLLAIVTLHL